MNAPAVRDMPTSLYDQCVPAEPPRCGCGVLLGGDEEVVLPLRSTSITARLLGPACETTVKQTFTNARSTALECVYLFPLPDGASVTSLVFVVGDRRLEARVLGKEEARQTYDEARDAGRKAALLEKERADVYRVSVASVAPGETVEVHLTTAGLLAFDDGGFVLRLPLVLAPRYTPEGTTLDQPPRLLPGVRPAHDLSIDVQIDPGALRITDLSSSQHATSTGLGDGTLRVSLAKADEIPNRDFVLRFRVTGDDVTGAAWAHGEGAERRALAVLLPPSDLRAAARVPREVVLVIDTSGSMGGTKMRAAIDAARIALRGLEPGDRLQVVDFDSRHRKLWRSPKEVTDATLAEADRFVARLSANGGTEILAPLKDVLASPSSLPRHVVLITDGQVGNEAEIVRWVRSLDQNLAVFSIGIDTAVHAAFLRSLSRETGGAATLLTPSDPLADRVTRFLARVATPLAASVRLVGAEGDVQPDPLPGLTLGEPVVALVSGPAEGLGFDLDSASGTRTVLLPPARSGDALLGRLSQAERVRTLDDRYGLEPSESLKSELLALSVESGVLSSVTGFVVVDPESTDGERADTFVVPVPAPDQWQDGAGGMPLMRSRSAMPMPAKPMAMSAPQGAPMSKRRAQRKGGFMAKVGSLFGGSAPPPAPARPKAELSLADADAEDRYELAEEPMRSGPESLGELVLRQRLDGSFTPRGDESVVAATAAALQRMLDAGSTDRVGTWRSHVAKAARWLLLNVPAAGADREAALSALQSWAAALGDADAEERVAAL